MSINVAFIFVLFVVFWTTNCSLKNYVTFSGHKSHMSQRYETAKATKSTVNRSLLYRSVISIKHLSHLSTTDEIQDLETH